MLLEQYVTWMSYFSVPQFPLLYSGASNIRRAHCSPRPSPLSQELALLTLKFSVYFSVNLSKQSGELVSLVHQSHHLAACLATVGIQ